MKYLIYNNNLNKYKNYIILFYLISYNIINIYLYKFNFYILYDLSIYI